MLDLAPDAIIVRDLRQRILFWNRGAEVMYGWSRAEAMGEIAYDLLKTAMKGALEKSGVKPEDVNQLVMGNIIANDEQKGTFFEALYNAGIAHQRCKQDAEAKAMFQKVLGEKSDFHRARVQAAEAREKQARLAVDAARLQLDCVLRRLIRQRHHHEREDEDGHEEGREGFVAHPAQDRAIRAFEIGCRAPLAAEFDGPAPCRPRPGGRGGKRLDVVCPWTAALDTGLCWLDAVPEQDSPQYVIRRLGKRAPVAFDHAIHLDVDADLPEPRHPSLLLSQFPL